MGVRVLIKQPVSMVAAIAALTLGIGLVTFMFCGLTALLFQTLHLTPSRKSDRLYPRCKRRLSSREFSEQQTPTFEGLSAFDARGVNFRASTSPSRRNACYVSGNFLDLLRVKPLLGRAFSSRRGHAPQRRQWLSWSATQLWQEEFQGDRAALGATVQVDGQPATVVGIMPPDFQVPVRAEIWVASVPASMACRVRAFETFGHRGAGLGRTAGHRGAPAAARAAREADVGTRLGGIL